MTQFLWPASDVRTCTCLNAQKLKVLFCSCNAFLRSTYKLQGLENLPTDRRHISLGTTG